MKIHDDVPYETNPLFYRFMKHTIYLLPLALTLILGACQGKEEAKQEVLRPVKYQVAGAGDGERIRSFSGFA